jgi:hypothetical protein
MADCHAFPEELREMLRLHGALSVRPCECSRQLLSPLTIGQFGWEAVADFALAWALNPTAIDERL